MIITKQKIKSNYELSKQLSPENDVVFTDMVCYLRTRDLNSWQTEEIIEEILGIILSAQARNEPLSAAIGTDYKSFCQEIAANARPQPFGMRVLEIIGIIINGLGILFIIDILSNFLPRMIREQKLILDYSLSLGTAVMVIGIISLSIGIVYYIGQRSFEITEEMYSSSSKIRRFALGGAIGGLVFLFILAKIKLNAYILFTVPIYYPIIIIGVLYVITSWLERKL